MDKTLITDKTQCKVGSGNILHPTKFILELADLLHILTSSTSLQRSFY